MADGKDGEVVYLICGDDSRLEADLNAAQKKVEKSGRAGAEKTEQIEKKTSESVKQSKEEVTEHHKQQNDERTKDDEDTGKQREETERTTGEKIKSLAGGTAKAIGAGMLAAGTAVIGIGTAAVNSAVEMDQAMNAFLSTTGKGTEETERYQTVMEQIYTNNYGESFEDIADSMASVTKQLGDMDDASLQTVTESAFALRDTFGYEIPESTRAAKAMMDNFGISGEEAMGLIAAGAQNGLDYSGELIDSINEYSTQFAKVGMDADDMFKIFESGAESGAWNIDKIGDAVKEFGIRSIDGSDATREGFKSIGMDADEMASKFVAGGDTAKQAFQDTINALSGMEDPLAQNAAGVALFGTMWEDLGPEAVAAMADIQEGAYDTADAMNGIKEVKYDDIGSMFEGLKRSVEMLMLPLGEQLIPILDELIQSALPLLQEALPPLMEMVSELITQIAPMIEEILPVLISLFETLLPPLMELIGAVLPVLTTLISAILPIFQMLLDLLAPLIVCFAEMLAPIVGLIGEALTPLLAALQPVVDIISAILIPILQVLMSVFQEVMAGIVANVTTQINSVTDIFKNLIDFIKNVFAGDWQAAWENIKGIFKAVADSLGAIFKTPINTMIDMINGFLEGISKIEIPEWVPVFGGKGFDIPKIPRLKTGIDFVPSDYFPAYLDFGERVLTKEENVRFSTFGGLSGMEAMLSVRQSSPDPGLAEAIKANTEAVKEQKFVMEKGAIAVTQELDGKMTGRVLAPYVDTEFGKGGSKDGRKG